MTNKWNRKVKAQIAFTFCFVWCYIQTHPTDMLESKNLVGYGYLSQHINEDHLDRQPANILHQGVHFDKPRVASKTTMSK